MVSMDIDPRLSWLPVGPQVTKTHLDTIICGLRWPHLKTTTRTLPNYNGNSLLHGFGTKIDSQSTALIDATDIGVQKIVQRNTQVGEYPFNDQPNDNSILLSNGVVTQTISLGSQTVNGQVDSGNVVVANFDHLGVKISIVGDQVDGTTTSYSDGALDGKTIIVDKGTGGTFQLGGDSITGEQPEYDIPDLSAGNQFLYLSSISLGTQVTAEKNGRVSSNSDNGPYRLQRSDGPLGGSA